ncbi:MAG TPA: filamentous hemagglutinin family protein [Steroidobacteraceae bacterium]|nr:filamentous hemagglutinin family protein [Steroidobacteraceae bacterium]
MDQRISLVLTAAALEVAAGAGHAAELPVACVGGSCGPNIGFVTSGQASAISAGNTLTVTQSTDKAILNWQSFNIGADGRVTFKQPGASSVALNKIYDAAPSRIFGALEANGQVYLVNPNGMLFGATAQVKTAGLLASTLNMDDSVFDGGILSAVQKHEAALKAAVGPDGKVLSGDLVVEQGAQIATTGAGGRILLAAPDVENKGTLTAPDGQVILAAGEKIYLSSSSDASLRGLLVEVDGGGEAANRLSGNISAARGNVSLVGLAVNQEGRATATTSVSANGSVRLLARDTVSIRNDSSGVVLDTARTGTVELGAHSSISILPELADTTTAVDDQKQNPSTVEIMGRNVTLRGGTQIVAPGGAVNITALSNPSAPAGGYDPDSRVRIEDGTTIDVSGSDVTLPASRAVVAVELRANELKDSPVQRDGFLRGKTVYVDVRTGTPLADVSGAIAAIPKNIAERTSKGGTISINSQGDVGVAQGAKMDVSGGIVTYAPGVVQTTQLIGADGKIVDIGSADPNKQYVGLVNPTVQLTYDRWGVKENVRGPGTGNFVDSFLQGADAGMLQFAAPNMVLSGTFKGEVYQGPLQRNAKLAAAGGTLVIGTPTPPTSTPGDYRAPSVTFVNQAPSDPLDEDEPIVNGEQGLALSTDYLTAGGFTSTRIYSNGTVTVPASTPLDLTPGSAFSVLARRVNVDGNITSLGGTIDLTSDRTIGIADVELPDAGVFLGANAVLNVSGLWTNDLIDNTHPIRVDAGSIALNAKTFFDDQASHDVAATLSLGDNSQLIANGGAWLKSNGSLAAGKGGSISLNAQRANLTDGVVEIGENVGLQGFGVLGASGGKLTFTGARIDITHGSEWAAAQRFDSTEKTSASAIQLGDELFSGHGFTTFNIIADGTPFVPEATSPPLETSTNVLTVKSGSIIDTRTNVIALAADLTTRASGGTIDGFSALTTPLEWNRPASSVTFSAQPRVTTKTELGQVTVESNAVIRGPARSSFTFESPGGVTLAGQIVTPGGTITAGITPGPTESLDPGYIPDLRINVTSTAILDASGTTLLRPNDSGLQVGDVLAGGAINLIAQRGSVDLQRGSKLDVSGTSGVLDIADARSATGYTRQTVASAAGDITLHAPESILIAGDLAAHVGTGDTIAGRAAGGSLTVELTRDSQFQAPDPAVIGTFPTATRTIRIVPDAFTGSSLPDGQAILSMDRIEASGIDSLTLRASDFSAIGSGGQVSFDAGVNLALGRQLIVDSPVIDIAAGDAVKVSAPYVALGYSHEPGSVLPTATPGFGRLDVSAGQLDLIGTLAFQRVGHATLSSSGDLRLVGVIDGAASTGRLDASGELTLAAARIYPTTLTDYTVNVAGDKKNTLRIAQNGTSPGAPLSAAGSLHLSADEIVQGGTLLAPFGKIALDATDSVELLAGSTTSVSAKDALIPFGSIQVGSGTEWVYTLGGNVIAQDAIPERNVSISAPDVSMASGSTVDVSGGGDLYAYSWTPGTGGSKDALAASETPGLYAVIPGFAGLGTGDPQEYLSSDLQVGDSVYLGGGGGLDAGVYTLLPARYALLPGAYLVHAVSGFNDLQPGKTVSLPDGSTVVAGYRTFANTALGDTRYSGFAVNSGSFGRKMATYEDFKASEFFPAQAALSDSKARTALPADAGALSIAVTHSLAANGNVRTSAGEGGRGASIDISASHLEVTSGQQSSASENAVQIDSAVLASWNPGSLLLGGKRASDGSIAVTADTISFLSGSALSLNEVVAVANDGITVASGAQVSSKSAGTSDPAPVLTESQLKLTGDAAVLALSDTSDFTVDRTDGTDTGGGHVEVATGGRVASRGALLLDAPDGAQLNGTFDGLGATWTLASRRVALADETVDGGITLTSSLLDALQQGSAVRLQSRGAIDFMTSVSLGNAADPNASLLKSLTLSAATLGASDTVTVDLAAQSIVLAGKATDTDSPLATGAATLRLTGADVEIEDGALNLAGFGATTLRSTGALIAKGDSTLRTPGALELSAGRITTGTGAEASFESGDIVRVTRAGADPGASAAMELGGALSISGKQVEVSGNIVLPSGQISLRSDGDLSILTGATFDVSGVDVTAGGRTVSSSGGLIDMIAGGTLTAASGALLNVSGGGDQNGGALSLEAKGEVSIEATLRGTAGASARGASVLLEADSLRDFASLNSLLEAGGFAERRAIHVTRGDLELARGATLTARDVELTTDEGSIRIAGTIDADSDNARGVINLFAGGNITLQNGGVLRSEGAAGLGRGGLITLGSSNGFVSLLGGSTIDTLGANENGHVLQRANVVTEPGGNEEVAVGSLAAGTFTGVGSVTVEPVIAVDDAPSFLTSADLEVYRQRLDTFAAAIPDIRARLGAPAETPLHIQPGVELRVNGDVTLDGGVDFSTWRFGDQREAGALTVRATGSITLSNGTISDGFKATGTGAATRLDPLSERSTTLRFAAGASLASANPLAVDRSLAGDITIQDATVRTGTGDLLFSAARNINFTTTSDAAFATVYTGGQLDANLPGFADTRSRIFMAMPTGGGALTLDAGGDIVGNDVSQPVTAWQRRVGNDTDPVRWGVEVQQFHWNAGTLGGGDLTIRAGGDVREIAAATADSGYQSSQTVLNRGQGGVMTIDAGHDVASSLLHMTAGVNRIQAGGSLARTRASEFGDMLGSVLSIGDAQVDITARGDVFLESAFNSTMLKQIGTNQVQNLPSYFFTYGERSALDVQSMGGDVNLAADSDRLKALLGESIVDGSGAGLLTMLPASVSLRSLSHDVKLGGTPFMYASDSGQLDLFAARDVASNALLQMLDSAPRALPTPLNALPNTVDLLSQTPSARHVDDAQPALISAGRDVLAGQYVLPKAARVTADRDVVDLILRNQNLQPDAQTLVFAGRDIEFPTNNNGRFELGGPGRLDVIAGRNVDLGFSQGISTTGRLANAAIESEQGADVTVLAGVLPEYDPQTKVAPQTLTDFFTELVRAGREANTDPSTNFARGYAAIDKLFPGSRDTGDDKQSPYSGDVLLAFSRIYTLAGGTISLLAPGGHVDVGLAVPPAGAPTRLPSELGIVAQGAGDVRIFADGDVLVNSSRVFTLGGGDIAIWSTTGDIDAGRGSKSSVSAPAPTITVDDKGNVSVNFAGAVAGSGIRSIVTNPAVKAGDVDLIAPQGIVNAGDAGIGAAGNLNVAAQQVVGLDNIQVGGSSAGVPAEVSNLGASLSSVSAVASSASSASSAAVTETASTQQPPSLADAALGWLDVFIEGFGAEVCKPSDAECLKRSTTAH